MPNEYIPDKETTKITHLLPAISLILPCACAVMSIRLHPQDVIQRPEDDLDSGSCLSSSDEDEDQNDPKTWDDWVSDSQELRECCSLFEDKKLPSVAKAVEYDEQTHGFNLDRVSSKLGKYLLYLPAPFVSSTESLGCASSALDFHQRVRLVNYIRKQVAFLRASQFDKVMWLTTYHRNLPPRTFPP